MNLSSWSRRFELKFVALYCTRNVVGVRKILESNVVLVVHFYDIFCFVCFRFVLLACVELSHHLETIIHFICQPSASEQRQ